MVVVDKRHSHAAFFFADARRLGHILKLAVSFVAQQPDAVI